MPSGTLVLPGRPLELGGLPGLGRRQQPGPLTRPAAKAAFGAVVPPAALAIGVVTAYSTRLTFELVLVVIVAASVIVRPQLAAYLMVGVTPLVAGIDRGHAIPMFRPGEALALLLGFALAVRGVIRLRTGNLPRPSISKVEAAIVLMALSNSVLPMIWMAARSRPITQDDFLYALVMWKFLGVYVIVRVSITKRRQVLRCLWISLVVGAVVAALAILQSLGLFGIPHLMATYYAPFGYTGVVQNARGSSTLALPAATADLMLYNLAIAAGLALYGHRHRGLLAVLSVLFAAGALSAGEFSSAIGLVIAVCCIAVVTSYPRLLSMFIPFGAVALIALRPVIEKRLSGFDSVSGLPVSWTGRLQNLHSYFWPRLFSDWNFVLGVQPSARVPVASQGTGYVWIESGYTWLLWGGGIPLLLSFLFLVQAALAHTWWVARQDRGPVGVAALAVFVATSVISVLMVFDPHVTYRGAAEAYFGLLAMAGLASRLPAEVAEREPLDDQRLSMPRAPLEAGI
jgi:hypothetical protein